MLKKRRNLYESCFRFRAGQEEAGLKLFQTSLILIPPVNLDWIIFLRLPDEKWSPKKQRELCGSDNLESEISTQILGLERASHEVEDHGNLGDPSDATPPKEIRPY